MTCEILMMTDGGATNMVGGPNTTYRTHKKYTDSKVSEKFQVN